MMNVCFMGLGYIGLPTAIIAAKHGIKVAGVDINPKVVDTINQGRIHIVEPGLQALCEEVVKNGMLTAYTAPVESDAYFIVVPTMSSRRCRGMRIRKSLTSAEFLNNLS